MPLQALLLGTNHFDAEGETKLDVALTQFGPSHIFVEGSRESHQVNLATKEVALEVLARYSVSDAILDLLLFERNGLLRDISAVEKYGRSHPEIELGFFEDEPAPNIDATIEDMRSSTESVLREIQRMPYISQENLVRVQIAQIQNGFAAMKRDWATHGDTATEVHFAESLRGGIGSRKLDQRDEKKWSVLRDLANHHPEARIATITGAAHILRTSRGVSLLDKIEASRKFTVTRDMLGFR